MSRERWCFTQAELANPVACKATDELVAFRFDRGGIIVTRDGQVSNRWDDGTKGVSETDRAWADDQETLYNEEGDALDEWRDVMVSDEGEFIRFATAKDAEDYDAMEDDTAIIEAFHEDYHDSLIVARETAKDDVYLTCSACGGQWSVNLCSGGKTDPYDFEEVSQGDLSCWDNERHQKGVKRNVARLSRERIVQLLEGICIACYDEETTDELRECLIESVESGDIEECDLTEE